MIHKTAGKTICTLALTGLLSLGMTSFVQAQSADQTADQAAPMQGQRRQMNPDNQLAHLTKKLNLTSDQQTQIKPLLENQDQQIMQIHQDQSLSRQDKMAKVKSLHEDTSNKIEAVLNDQQKQQYQAMQQKMQERMQERHGGGAPPAPPQQ